MLKDKIIFTVSISLSVPANKAEKTRTFAIFRNHTRQFIRNSVELMNCSLSFVVDGGPFKSHTLGVLDASF